MPGFLSSSVALSVYKISDVSVVTTAKLRQFAFQSIDELPEAKGWGWTSIDDMFDTEWKRSVPEKADFLCFALRIDSRRVPSGVLKKHMAEQLAEEESKAAAEGKKVSRGRKKDLKEILSAKLLSECEPVPSSTDVAVDSSTGLVYVASNTTSTLEVFEQYFEFSFGVKLDRFEVETSEGCKILQAIYENGLEVALDGEEYLIGEGGCAYLVDPEKNFTRTPHSWILPPQSPKNSAKSPCRLKKDIRAEPASIYAG